MKYIIICIIFLSCAKNYAKPQIHESKSIGSDSILLLNWNGYDICNHETTWQIISCTLKGYTLTFDTPDELTYPIPNWAINKK